MIAGLGQGESAALVLAETLSADLLILDDLRARKFAQAQNREIIGILGVLLLQKLITHLTHELIKAKKFSLPYRRGRSRSLIFAYLSKVN